jgi:hypothetical protein
MTKKQDGERSEALLRIVVCIVSGVILYVWGYLWIVLVLANWIYALFVGKRSKDLAEFNEYYNTELYRFARYLSGMRNERPFPFTSMQRMSKFEK